MELQVTVVTTTDTRYTFTEQFLLASAIFTRKAKGIERQFGSSFLIPDDARCEHRAYVSSAIMQCTAAIEAETHEICVHGPGDYLGDDHKDNSAHKILLPIADQVDDLPVLERYDLILKSLGKPPLDKGKNPYQSARLLVRLRNMLVHYKSTWESEMSEEKLFKGLQSLAHKAPPFTTDRMNYFPHRCLSADCGAWALATTVEFLDDIYQRLGVKSRFDSCRSKLVP